MSADLANGLAAVPADALIAELTRRLQTVGPKTDWLRVKDAAREYGLAPATLYEWAYKRKVKTKKMGTAKNAPLLLWRPDLERRARIRPALENHQET